MNELLEEARVAAIQKTLNALTGLVEDTKAEAKDRIEAGKVINRMCDDIAKVEFVDKALTTEDSTKRKMIDKLDRLTDKDL